MDLELDRTELQRAVKFLAKLLDDISTQRDVVDRTLPPPPAIEEPREVKPPIPQTETQVPSEMREVAPPPRSPVLGDSAVAAGLEPPGVSFVSAPETSEPTDAPLASSVADLSPPAVPPSTEPIPQSPQELLLSYDWSPPQPVVEAMPIPEVPWTDSWLNEDRRVPIRPTDKERAENFDVEERIGRTVQADVVETQQDIQRYQHAVNMRQYDYNTQMARDVANDYNRLNDITTYLEMGRNTLTDTNL